MGNTKGECAFIGCASSALFLFETIESAADRGYGVIVEPVGGENNRAFNLYQITPSKAKSAPDLYEALKEVMKASKYWVAEIEHRIESTEALNKAVKALAKAEGGK